MMLPDGGRQPAPQSVPTLYSHPLGGSVPWHPSQPPKPSAPKEYDAMSHPIGESVPPNFSRPWDSIAPKPFSPPQGPSDHSASFPLRRRRATEHSATDRRGAAYFALPLRLVARPRHVRGQALEPTRRLSCGAGRLHVRPEAPVRCRGWTVANTNPKGVSYSNLETWL